MTRDELFDELNNCTGPVEAMPHIDTYVAAERERIAQAIENSATNVSDVHAFKRAARIARAES